MGSTALAVAAAAPGALLLIQPGIAAREPVMTIYDGSEDSLQALRIAIRLANMRQARLVVFVLADAPDVGAEREAEVRRLINGRSKHVRFRQLTKPDAHQFAQVVEAEGKGLLVLPRSSRLAQGPAFRTLLEETSNPVLLTRQSHAATHS
jgi:hypothetical protein